jgi:hypothetical protein
MDVIGKLTHIFNLVSEWRSLASFTSGENSPVPSRQETGWATEPVLTVAKREIFSTAGIRTPVVHPVAWSLYYLSYRDLIKI